MTSKARFEVYFAGEEHQADDWKGLRTLISKCAYPLVMKQILIKDRLRKRNLSLIVRRDAGRPRIVKDSGQPFPLRWKEN